MFLASPKYLYYAILHSKQYCGTIISSIFQFRKQIQKGEATYTNINSRKPGQGLQFVFSLPKFLTLSSPELDRFCSYYGILLTLKVTQRKIQALEQDSLALSFSLCQCQTPPLQGWHRAASSHIPLPGKECWTGMWIVVRGHPPAVTAIRVGSVAKLLHQMSWPSCNTSHCINETWPEITRTYSIASCLL